MAEQTQVHREQAGINAAAVRSAETAESTQQRLPRCRKLLFQFEVDMYAKIKTERLSFIRHNQTRLRADDYIYLHDAVADDRNANRLGNMVILPSSFTSCPRYMHERTQDAMTYVRHYCRPDLFITFTCNSKWDEISNELLPGQQSYDRHDVVARVFHLKLKQLMDYITTGAIFGAVRCHIYTIEWQKRGLPNAHILTWLWFHVPSTGSMWPAKQWFTLHERRFPIHARHPTVQHLSVHLENGQRVYFTEANLQQQLQEPRDTTLTAFFKLCTLDDFARTLLYCQLPAYYTFDASTKCWKRRVQGSSVPDHPGIYQTDALARVYTVHPNNRECFFLRIILHHVVGPVSFHHLRTVEGHVCATFHETCRRLGLLKDDAQWREALEEAATVRSPA
ncbi:uncharacterized protein [Watersipora subatra]|uniref:uncharacterized protein n=1 Tax=Watersipora subatra TaxID=2589382 RepID=UPI00355C7109